jgi:hypothetical protein
MGGALLPRYGPHRVGSGGKRGSSPPRKPIRKPGPAGSSDFRTDRGAAPVFERIQPDQKSCFRAGTRRLGQGKSGYRTMRRGAPRRGPSVYKVVPETVTMAVWRNRAVSTAECSPGIRIICANCMPNFSESTGKSGRSDAKPLSSCRKRFRGISRKLRRAPLRGR